MARSQTNLTVGVGIDTSKFIADSAIVRNEISKINKEIAAAARAGDVPRLQAAAAEKDRLIKQNAALAQSIRGVTAAHKEAVPVFTQLGGAFTLLRSKTLMVTGAISGVVYGLVRLVDSAAKSVDAIEDVAAAAGITSKQLQAMQLAGAKVGSSAEDVNAGLLRWTRTVGAARKQAEDAATAFDLMTDEEKAEVIEKERRGILSYTNVLVELGIATQNYAKTEAGNNALRRDTAIALDKITDATERADKAQQLFGKGWAKQIENIKAGKDDFADAAKELERLGIAITPEESAQAAASLASLNTFGQVFGRTMAMVGNTISVAVVPILDGLTKFIVENQPVWQQWAEAIGFAITTVSQIIQGLWIVFRAVVQGITDNAQEIGKAADSFVVAWDAAFSWFGNKINTVLEWFDWLIAKAKEAWNWISAAGGATPTATEVGVRLAAGGSVSGPGTGTSDSILAWLSNGEFVLNAASVRRLGVGFLHGLNSFAAGGLVSMPPIRFADGGLATAGAGGTPVHLHLGGQSFALAGQAGVVKALVSEAHAQQMRSAGVKPSWVAGRPGGR